MNENKIAFIICTNNQLYFNECCYYINRLLLPEGFERDVIGIEDAPSMCAGYNAGMQSSDAKYKVYLHHDVFIKESKFIFYLLERFCSAPDVGMIGMVALWIAGSRILHISSSATRHSRQTVWWMRWTDF